MNKFIDINPKKDAHEHSFEEMEKTGLWRKFKNLFLGIISSNLAKWLIILLGLWLAIKVLMSFGLLPLSSFPVVDPNKWQAVFLTNGQVYFGHLQKAGKDYTVLKNVYYLQVPQQSQSSNAQQQIGVVKLGSEIHKPEDIMYIPKSQIIFWENMKDDSAVVEVIKKTEGK